MLAVFFVAPTLQAESPAELCSEELCEASGALTSVLRGKVVETYVTGDQQVRVSAVLASGNADVAVGELVDVFRGTYVEDGEEVVVLRSAHEFGVRTSMRALRDGAVQCGSGETQRLPLEDYVVAAQSDTCEADLSYLDPPYEPGCGFPSCSAAGVSSTRLAPWLALAFLACVLVGVRRSRDSCTSSKQGRTVDSMR
jgi:hypothetical protein